MLAFQSNDGVIWSQRDWSEKKVLGMIVVPCFGFGTADMSVGSSLLKALWGCSSPVLLLVVQSFTIPPCCLDA